LNFTGKGKRRVRVGYVVESPVWKSSYRLSVGKEGKPMLQGWAFVQNPTDEDWSGVTMRLVSGRPISFRMEMYQPHYVKRPLVELEHFAGLTPPIHEGELESKGKPAGAAASAGEAFRDRNQPNTANGGVQAEAIAGRLGDYFHYSVKEPVNLPRRKSALIPIISQPIEGKKVSLFNEKTHAKYPLLGLRIKNTSGQHLMQGPIAVFDEGSYAGDARLFDLQPNEERIISYGVDLGVEVESAAKDGKEGERLVSIRIANGILHATHIIREKRSYTVKNRSEDDRVVIVEHPIRQGVKLIEPADAQRTRDSYRFTVPVAKGKKESLEVVEERDRLEQIVLTNADDSRLKIFLASPALGSKAKEALRKAGELKGRAAAARREVVGIEKELKDLVEDQGRIRANMARVGEKTEAYGRYLKKLEDQEKEIERLQEQLKKLRAVEQQRRREYESYLANLSIG
jgi:hypothetical protein